MKYFNCATVLAAVSAVNLEKHGSNHEIPSLNVPKCGVSKPAIADLFELPSGKGSFPAETNVEVCWTENYLSLTFNGKGDKFLKNDIKGDNNGPLY